MPAIAGQTAGGSFVRMTSPSAVEAWLRGPVPDVPALLMPVAHALLQAREELARAVEGVDSATLWRKPGDAAPAGFHLRHIAGATDRLLTYARGEGLSDAQRRAAADEKADAGPDGVALLRSAEMAIDRALAQIRATDPATLLDPRAVGRAGLPSTVLGLLFHTAEHTARHTGQLITTLRMVRGASR
jgi:uncharacterized damage-inducible protein DinB